MIDAIYSAEFFSNNYKVGSGILVLHEGKLYGADQHYAYKGEYQLAGQSRSPAPEVEARVVVDNYTDETVSQVGLPHFRLLLYGAIEADGLSLSGSIDGNPAHMIQIRMKSISDLAEH